MKRQTVKIILDVVMTVLFILLMDTVATGLLWHEILGLGICVLFTVHKLLNGKWIAQVTRRFFDKKLPGKTKVLYVLDWLLLLGMGGCMVTGILMSEYIFPGLQVSDFYRMSMLHASFAYSTLIILSVHIGFHWKCLLEAFRKMFRLPKVKKAGSIVLHLSAAIMVLLGIKNSVQQNIGSIILQPLSQEDENDTQTYADTEAAITTESTTYLSQNTAGNIQQITDSTQAEDTPTLEEYLGSLVCTACSRHCSLLYPACGKGRAQARAATADYNDLYAEAAVTPTASPEATAQPTLTPAPTAGQTAEETDSESTAITASQTVASLPTLQEYLGGLFCTGCHRHCPLLAPQCARGYTQAQEATQDYQAMVEEAEATAAQQNTENEDTDDTNTGVLLSTDESDSSGTGAAVGRILAPFGEFIPVMSLYIAGTHYMIRLTDQKKKKGTLPAKG